MKITLITLCSILLAGCDLVGHESQPKAADHFQLAVDSNGNAWVLDTRTGESKRCWQGSVGSTPPTCYIAIQNTGASPSTANGGFSVKAPNGKTYNFPNQKSADAFKKEAGL